MEGTKKLEQWRWRPLNFFRDTQGIEIFFNGTQEIPSIQTTDLFWLSFSCFEYLNIVLVQEEIDKRLVEILGPKTEADNIKPVKKKKEKPAKVEVGNHMYHSSLN